MSLDLLKYIFVEMPSCKEWHAHLLGFTHSKRHGSTYNCRRIEIEPKTKIQSLVQDISEGYTMGAKSKFGKYTDVREYDGTCNATIVSLFLL